MVETAAIKCFATGIIFEIRRDSSCQTKNCDIRSILFKLPKAMRWFNCMLEGTPEKL